VAQRLRLAHQIQRAAAAPAAAHALELPRRARAEAPRELVRGPSSRSRRRPTSTPGPP
jgi:hypothetical protein